MKQHEKEVYDALYKYFNTVILESGCLNSVMEMGKMRSDGEANKWSFEWEHDDSSGGFVFCCKDIEVHAEPYYEYAEGIAYAIYENGELRVDGTLPLVVTGDECADFAEYLRLVKDEIIGKCL